MVSDKSRNSEQHKSEVIPLKHRENELKQIY